MARSSLCDGYVDCGDGSDEQNCESLVCPEDRWKCADNRKCILDTKVCDQQNDCLDLSDEWVETCESWTCPGRRWKCPDLSGCITEQLVCDGNPGDCEDSSDESTELCEKWSCTEGWWKCADNKKCIDQKRFATKSYIVRMDQMSPLKHVETGPAVIICGNAAVQNASVKIMCVMEMLIVLMGQTNL